ncbi:MAG: hypothetical protein ABSH05_11810 [Bryobacteraceae bacterium]|jgi:hypothetical protein
MRLTTFEELNTANARLTYWLTRPPVERIAEVERLRREYLEWLRGVRADVASEGLRGSLRLVERPEP